MRWLKPSISSAEVYRENHIRPRYSAKVACGRLGRSDKVSSSGGSGLGMKRMIGERQVDRAAFLRVFAGAAPAG